MKEATQKMTRGQMIYAPINSSDRISKSPFSSSKKILIRQKNSESPQNQQSFTRQTAHNSQNIQTAQNSQQTAQFQQTPQQSHIKFNDEVVTTPKHSGPSYHNYEEQLQNLIKQNEQLRVRQQIYISKLMKLQEGLQKQHDEFMNLQQLYTELFNGYKQKQEEIAQLQLRYKQTSHQRNEFNSFKKQQQSLINAQKMNYIKNSLVEENFKNQLTQLIYQNKRLNDTNQKLVSELNYIRSKEKLAESRQTLEQKVFQDLNDWHKQADSSKQETIKLQYENRFYKMRNQDLEKTITQLQKIVSMKQNEIIKMRQEKLCIRRQSSEKVLNRSPPKSSVDSARSKSSNQESKKLVKLIQNLQKQNHRLRDQNLNLKQRLKVTLFNKQNSRSYDEMSKDSHRITNSVHRKLQFGTNESNISESRERRHHNENFNSQNTNEQYFSFSRQRQEKVSSDEDLPTFPMDLQIEGIIKKHRPVSKLNQPGQKAQHTVQNVL